MKQIAIASTGTQKVSVLAILSHVNRGGELTASAKNRYKKILAGQARICQSNKKVVRNDVVNRCRRLVNQPYLGGRLKHNDQKHTSRWTCHRNGLNLKHDQFRGSQRSSVVSWCNRTWLRGYGSTWT